MSDINTETINLITKPSHKNYFQEIKTDSFITIDSNRNTVFTWMNNFKIHESNTTLEIGLHKPLDELKPKLVIKYDNNDIRHINFNDELNFSCNDNQTECEKVINKKDINLKIQLTELRNRLILYYKINHSKQKRVTINLNKKKRVGKISLEKFTTNYIINNGDDTCKNKTTFGVLMQPILGKSFINRDDKHVKQYLNTVAEEYNNYNNECSFETLGFSFDGIINNDYIIITNEKRDKTKIKNKIRNFISNNLND